MESMLPKKKPRAKTAPGTSFGDQSSSESDSDSDSGDEYDYGGPTVHDSLNGTVLAPLQPFLKQYWTPVFEDGDGELTDNKINGTPYCPQRAPTCPHCNLIMPLFFQLNIETLPDVWKRQLGDRGMIQLFYCSRDDCDMHGGFEPFGSTHVQLYYPEVKSEPTELTGEKRKSAPTSINGAKAPPRVIVDWKPHFGNYPNNNDYGPLNLDSIYNTVEHDNWHDNVARMVPRNRLGGWPWWIQGAAWVDCPKCNLKMDFVFQYDGLLSGHMLGDGGLGHLLQCQHHRDQISFGWACG